LRTLANAGVGAISTEFGARGPSNNYVQGEIAGAAAIYEACHHLMEGRCDAAIVTGYESLLVPSMVMAFRQMGLLSEGGFEASYLPFQAGRPGMVLGEGAGCLILERHADATSRQADILAEIDGVGLASQSADEDGLTAPVDDIRAAAAEAMGSIAPRFVVARGLGTEADDLAEARALEGLLPHDALVTALKGNTGYLGAATAPVELGIGLLCARRGFVPPVFGLTAPDPRIHLALVEYRPAPLSHAEAPGLFLSSTFGGQIASIAAHPVAEVRR
jgi:3-oxoacyl-(acyl-carrier-protein) synthase